LATWNFHEFSPRPQIDLKTTPQFTANSGVVTFDQVYRYTRHEAADAVSDHRPAWADFSADQAGTTTGPE